MGDRNTGIGRDQLRDYTLKRQDLSPDGLVWQEPVIDKDLTTPPGSPSTDNRYLIISGASGTDWAGHDNDIAHYHNGQWNYYTPIEGWFAWVNDENKLYRFDGSSWAEFEAGGAGGSASYTTSFVNGDLSSGILTVTHNLGFTYPLVIIFDNNNKVISPDEIEYKTTNSVEVDLSSYGTIAGTWNVRVVGGAWSQAIIKDDDNDTKIQVEESADEDKIRFDTAGVERMILDSTGLTLELDINMNSHDLMAVGNLQLKENGRIYLDDRYNSVYLEYSYPEFNGSLILRDIQYLVYPGWGQICFFAGADGSGLWSPYIEGSSGGTGLLLSATESGEYIKLSSAGNVRISPGIADAAGANGVTIAELKDAVDKKHTSGSETMGGDISGTVGNASVKTDDFTIKKVSNTLKIADRIELNTMLNAFRIAINGSLSQFNMVDGITDEYEDESGIDTVNSLNEDYDSSNDLYEPTTVAGLELDYMEYATDEAAQAAYVSSDVYDNSNDKLLLHCNGADESTTFTDATGRHTPTANDNAQLDTAEKKFGTASGLFDGTGDYLSITDSADWDIWDSTSDNWTIDFWVKMNVVQSSGLIRQLQDGDNRWFFLHEAGSFLLYVRSGGVNRIGIVETYSFDTNWHHIAVCKIAEKIGLYVDGVQIGYDTFSVTVNLTAELHIGGEPGSYLNGHMDEIRIAQDNIFNANPNATPDDTIDVPTSEYGANNLQSYSEGTIKNQGSYSLKAVALITDSLNDTLTKSGLSLDLTDKNELKIDVRASRTGTNLQLQLKESGVIDSYTKLLLHCNGTDGSTTIPDSGNTNHGNATIGGNAQLDTAYKKFGTASLLLDGTGDYINFADHVDWNFGAGDFTIDFRVRFNSVAGFQFLCEQVDGSEKMRIYKDGDTIAFNHSYNSGASSVYAVSGSLSLVVDTWYHVAFVRNGTDFRLYLDGVSIASNTGDVTLDDISSPFYIGSSATPSDYFNGWIDEFRVSKGIARWTSDFSGSLPSSEYPIITHTKDINITSADVFQEITWDISGIANANKDDITKIIFKILNADSATTYYIDNFRVDGVTNNMTLISDSFTAEAAPDDARIVLFEEDVDSITENTDIKAYVSRDGGSNYAQVTLSDEGNYQSGKRILTGVVDLTGIASGTNIEYKITTLNNKSLKLHGVGLHWD